MKPMHYQESIPFNAVDSLTPVNEKLCGKYLKSFAYYTLKERLPVILTVIVDNLVRNKYEITKWIESAEAELKACIGKLSKLKNEIQTNKNFIEIPGKEEIVKIWNEYLESLRKGSHPLCWFDCPWLLSECYLYRRLQSIFEESTVLRNYDCFAYQKNESFEKCITDIETLGHYIMNVVANYEAKKSEYFFNLIKVALWGNRCDLSISEEYDSGKNKLSVLQIKSWDSFILHDDSQGLYSLLTESSRIRVIDYVLDNAGFELFCDLCFCDFLCTCSLATKIRFHMKKHPWYVSDATTNDLKELLRRMRVIGLQELANRWENYLTENFWIIYEENYWTTPFNYPEMVDRDPALYQMLCQSNLVVFKGDLNYRKLLSDINWKHSEKFSTVLGRFRPENILALRTIKSDILCGLNPLNAVELPSDLLWMRTGQFAVIQVWSAYS